MYEKGGPNVGVDQMWGTRLILMSTDATVDHKFRCYLMGKDVDTIRYMCIEKGETVEMSSYLPLKCQKTNSAQPKLYLCSWRTNNHLRKLLIMWRHRWKMPRRKGRKRREQIPGCSMIDIATTICAGMGSTRRGKRSLLGQIFCIDPPGSWLVRRFHIVFRFRVLGFIPD